MRKPRIVPRSASLDNLELETILYLVNYFKKLSQSAVLTDWESLGCYAFASRVVASVFLAARRYSTLAAVLYLL